MAKTSKTISGATLIIDNTPLIRLQQRLQNGLRQAGFMYRDEVKRRISRWGSISIVGGILRLRLVHSRPGEPPRKQTENLYNSIKASESAVPNFSAAQKFRLPDIEQAAVVSTDVPYAKILEEGGLSILGAPTPYTSWQLINPIMKVIRILPRPVWRPVLAYMQRRMLNRIYKGIGTFSG